MAPSDILNKLRRQPFQPLRVYLSDGSHHDVNEQGYAAINVTELYIGIEPDDTGVPTRTIYCDTRHVTRIEPMPRESGGNGNGH